MSLDRTRFLQAVATVNEAIVWHEREARACQRNIDGLAKLDKRSGGIREGIAMNEGALKIHRKAIGQLRAVFPYGIGDL